MTQRLNVLGGRPALAAIALMNLITGGVGLVVLAPLSFGADAATFRRGAFALAAGGYDKDFLYSPLAAALATPLTWGSEAGAAVVMAGIGVLLLTLGVTAETRGIELTDRLLVLVAAVGFLPVVNELLLGQITLVFAAAMWPVTYKSDRIRNGIPLGIVLALAPKPAFLPLLVWMALRRRRALTGLVIAAGATGTIGLLALGPDAHVRWLGVLMRAGNVTRSGSLSLWADGMTWSALSLALLVVVALFLCVRRSEGAGLIAALIAGLLLSPYTLLYSVTILLLVVRLAVRMAPQATRLVALTGNLALIAVPVAWLGGTLLFLAALVRPAAPRRPAGRLAAALRGAQDRSR